jgi:hypothetical protein
MILRFACRIGFRSSIGRTRTRFSRGEEKRSEATRVLFLIRHPERRRGPADGSFFFAKRYCPPQERAAAEGPMRIEPFVGTVPRFFRYKGNPPGFLRRGLRCRWRCYPINILNLCSQSQLGPSAAARLNAPIKHTFSLVPKLHLGTPLSAQFHCSVTHHAAGIGNRVASASAFPNGVWERGGASHQRSCRSSLRMTDF